MNLLNLPKEEIEKKLKEYGDVTNDFELYFKIGRQYMKKYNTKPVNLHTKEGQEQIRKIVFAMTEEIYEFCNILKNKSWTKEDYPVDEEHAMEELCDVFAFWIQLLLLLNFDEKKFRELYIRKEIVNDFRLRTKY